MKGLRESLQDAVLPGLLAGGAVCVAVAVLGRRDSGSAIAPLNATSHILYGDRAARVEHLTLRHSLPGLAINIGSGVWWAAIQQKLFGAVSDRRGWGFAAASGLGTAALAYLVDYVLLPRRLTPGWELRLSNRSLLTSLGVLGLTIGLGSRLRRPGR